MNAAVVAYNPAMIGAGSRVISTPDAASPVTTRTFPNDATIMIQAGRECQK